MLDRDTHLSQIRVCYWTHLRTQGMRRRHCRGRMGDLVSFLSYIVVQKSHQKLYIKVELVQKMEYTDHCFISCVPTYVEISTSRFRFKSGSPWTMQDTDIVIIPQVCWRLLFSKTGVSQVLKNCHIYPNILSRTLLKACEFTCTLCCSCAKMPRVWRF